MGDFRDALWQQTYQVKPIVLGNVRMLRTMQTMEIYLVSLLPPSVPKFPIVLYWVCTVIAKEITTNNILSFLLLHR